MTSLSGKEKQAGSNEVKIKYQEEPPAGRLKLFDLYTIALGGVVGAGVVSLTGAALGMTGITMWFAYILAIFLGAITNIPYFFVSSTLRLGGGEYSTIGALLNEKVAGLYVLVRLLYPIWFGTYAISFASYMFSIFPGLNVKLVGLIFIAVLFIINSFGISASSKAQNIMFILLIVGLGSFIIAGIPKITNPVFNFSAPEHFTGGAKGFIDAIVTLAVSCQAYNMVTQYGRDANNAKRDIPKSMLLILPTLIVLYGGCALVASGILPLSEIANQPLTYTAQAIMPDWLFIIFIIGVIMAIATTINGTMVGSMNIISQSVDNGWLPGIINKKNKHGVPVAILAYDCICACIPVITGLNIGSLAQYHNLIMPSLSILFTIAVLQLPKKYPNSWNKSMFNMPNSLFKIVMVISLIAQASMLSNSLINLDKIVILSAIVLFILIMIYVNYKSKKQIKIEISAWE
jgi:APA family basic amino acid/polyamine antiporter